MSGRGCYYDNATALESGHQKVLSDYFFHLIAVAVAVHFGPAGPVSPVGPVKSMSL